MSKLAVLTLSLSLHSHVDVKCFTFQAVLHCLLSSCTELQKKTKTKKTQHGLKLGKKAQIDKAPTTLCDVTELYFFTLYKVE